MDKFGFCKTCDEITSLSNMFEDRSYSGNCYQSLCKCNKIEDFTQNGYDQLIKELMVH